MGAEAFASRARAELLAAGGQVQRHRSDVYTSLTAQEGLVARLAASGATNSEIAAQMFLSANTVDYHLRHIYRKLGVTSRTKMAAAFTARERAAPGW